MSTRARREGSLRPFAGSALPRLVLRLLPGGASWVLSSYAANYLFQGIYFVVVARALGAHEFGLFGAALAICSVAAPFAGLGSGNVLVLRTSLGRDSFRRQFGNAAVLILVSGSGLAAILIVAVGAVTPALGNLLLPLAVGELIFARYLDVSIQAYQAHDRLPGGALLLASSAALRCIAALGLLAFITPTALNWAYCYAGVSLLAAAFGALLACREFGGPLLKASDLRIHWRSGVHFSLGTASKSIYADADKYLLLALIGPAVAGSFTVAYRIVGFAFTPPQALVYSRNTAMYRAGEHGAEESWRLARELLPACLRLSLLSFLAVLAAIPLAPAVFGGDYDDLPLMLAWLALLPVVQAVHYLLGDTLMGLGRQGQRSALQLATAAVNVGLSLWLIPLWSWRGAAVATLMSELLLVLGLLVLFRRERARQRTSAHDRPVSCS